MAELTRAQKARLGVFLLVAAVLVVGSVIALVGTALLEQRDHYFVYFEGSVSGLEAGSAVKYNGIQVGRVESLAVNVDDVGQIAVELSLHGGTPVKQDTSAVLTLQGITGQMFIELTGGTNEAARLEPGGTIKSRPSALGSLLERADSITLKLESLVENLVSLTGEDNAKQIEETLAEVRTISGHVREFTGTIGARVDAVMANVEQGTGEVTELVRDARALIASVTTGVEQVSSWVDPTQISSMLRAIEAAVRAAEKRLGPQEFGAALAGFTELTTEGKRLTATANVTLLRARDDILRALDEFVTGAEAFSEFAIILRDDPAALLRGRSAVERTLP